MRFQVPQFIEVEDKIFGPLTIKQFIYVAGGGGLSFVIYTYIYFWLAIPLIALVLAFAAALAFYKPNNRPFISVLESAFKYSFTKKLYIWQKRPSQPVPKERKVETAQLRVPKLSDSKLKDLTWSLDINENSSLGANESMRER